VVIGRQIATLKQERDILMGEKNEGDEILEEGALTEIQQVEGIQGATGKAIWVAIGRQIIKLKQELEGLRSTRRISFEEASRILEGKIDLEAARKEAIEAHTRWGLVDALIQMGVIKDAKDYERFFDGITLSEKDVQKVKK